MSDHATRTVYPVGFCGCDGSKPCAHRDEPTEPVKLEHDPSRCIRCKVRKDALEGFGRG